jgi:hypothetical protein
MIAVRRIQWNSNTVIENGLTWAWKKVSAHLPQEEGNKTMLVARTPLSPEVTCAVRNRNRGYCLQETNGRACRRTRHRSVRGCRSAAVLPGGPAGICGRHRRGGHSTVEVGPSAGLQLWLLLPWRLIVGRSERAWHGGSRRERSRRCCRCGVPGCSVFPHLLRVLARWVSGHGSRPGFSGDRRRAEGI